MGPIEHSPGSIRTIISRATYRYGFHRRCRVCGLECAFTFAARRSGGCRPLSTPSCAAHAGLARRWEIGPSAEFDTIRRAAFRPRVLRLLKSGVLPLHYGGSNPKVQSDTTGASTPTCCYRAAQLDRRPSVAVRVRIDPARQRRRAHLGLDVGLRRSGRRTPSSTEPRHERTIRAVPKRPRRRCAAPSGGARRPPLRSRCGHRRDRLPPKVAATSATAPSAPQCAARVRAQLKRPPSPRPNGGTAQRHVSLRKCGRPSASRRSPRPHASASADVEEERARRSRVAPPTSSNIASAIGLGASASSARNTAPASALPPPSPPPDRHHLVDADPEAGAASPPARVRDGRGPIGEVVLPAESRCGSPRTVE